MSVDIKKISRFSACLFVLALFFVFFPKNTYAGFGISPPYVKNTHLIPGSVYEQEISLLRSSAESDMQAIVSIDAPEISEWLTIDKGNRFLLPKDQLRVQMKVRVSVPSNADIGTYEGAINIKVAPLEEKGEGVSVALGARVDISLNITNETISDFVVRNVVIPNFEELDWPWNSWLLRRFFYKARVHATIENTGNSKVAPSRILLDIFDITEKNLLESSYDNSLEKIEPFSTKEIIAAFPTKLSAAQYWARVKIYKDEAVIGSYKYAFTIAKKGELGTNNLGFWPWIFVGTGLLLSVVIVFMLIKYRAWRLIIFIASAIWQIASPIIKGLKGGIREARTNFWKWMLKKAKEHEKRRK